MANRLANESSLYLQQHKDNPVDWYPWGSEAWEKAKNENKLVIVSIGYSSCHWCHVMEHETFEDEGAAALMNKYFVCIKVDREERPDIDQVYMAAVQLMTGSGGWPMNCFTLPDGRPIYGGTYFPNVSWKDLLMKIENFYRTNPDQAFEYADELTKGISTGDQFKLKSEGPEKGLLPVILENWKKYFDTIHGGPNRAPKFPLPNNYEFLLRYSMQKEDKHIADYVNLTLKKMAFGGIYDQLAGGFARYSTDSLWKVPHFEKMLYDNAQLISLYSKAYKAFGNELYKEVVYDTGNFLQEEMSDGNGSYFSAFDADSEGVEGKYYVWKKEDLDTISLPEIEGVNGRQLLFDYFNINEKGYWEDENYILLRHEEDDVIAKRYNLSVDALKIYIQVCKDRLLTEREKRIRPGLDTKVVVSWNALMITGWCDAYEAFSDEAFLNRAIQSMEAILSKAVNEKGFLLHLESQKEKLNAGFLEDYAFTISALIRLYECTFEEKYLQRAKKFADDAISYFYDASNGFFFFNSTLDEELIMRKKEIHDNVIPSSNSEMAKCLFILSRHFDETNFEKSSMQMMSTVQDDLVRYASSYSNWGLLYMDLTEKFREIVIEGPDAIPLKKELSARYRSGILYAGGTTSSELPLRKGRHDLNETLIYICENKSCLLPVKTLEKAKEILD